ncbi:hypothetical protein [Paenibacillus sp. FSL P2-0322]|jgi:hypothetical protein|uniref:hypothetical protein n=1 Tax=unclassified Paenibacillus TaxID=185978 RepID=UPI0030CA5E93
MADVFPHTIHDLERGKYSIITIPKDKKAEFEYTVNADRPQGLAIYDFNHINIKEYLSTDNFPSNESIQRTDHDATYYLAGFSFYPAPIPNGEWIQSKMKIESSDGHDLHIGFDDYMNDGDYNDIVVVVKIN